MCSSDLIFIFISYQVVLCLLFYFIFLSYPLLGLRPKPNWAQDKPQQPSNVAKPGPRAQAINLTYKPDLAWQPSPSNRTLAQAFGLALPCVAHQPQWFATLSYEPAQTSLSFSLSPSRFVARHFLRDARPAVPAPSPNDQGPALHPDQTPSSLHACPLIMPLHHPSPWLLACRPWPCLYKV